MVFSQIDAKQRAIAAGLNGAFCLNCYATLEDAKDLNKIKQGFSIEREMDTIKNYWEKHKVLNEDGNNDFISVLTKF